MELFKVLGEEWYIDIDNVSSSIKLNTTIDDLLESGEPIDTDSDEEDVQMVRYNKSDLIDMTKWDVIKHCIEAVFNEMETVDETLGVKSVKDLSIPFRIAFNTLIKNKIIRKNG